MSSVCFFVGRRRGCGLPRAVRALAMTGFFCKGCRGFPTVRRGGALPLPRATARVAPTDDKEICASPGAGRCGHRPLRRGYKGCGTEWNPPATALPCQPPFRQGGRGERIATTSFRTGLAMTGVFARGAVGRATARVAPTEGVHGVRWAGNRKGRPSGKYG